MRDLQDMAEKLSSTKDMLVRPTAEGDGLLFTAMPAPPSTLVDLQILNPYSLLLHPA